VSQPSNFPDWATEDIQEVKDNSNGIPTTYENKLEPTEEIKDSGFLYRQNALRGYINWNFNLLGLWIRYLNDRHVIGDIHPTTTGETPAEISERLGGSWVSIGTQSIGGDTVEYFKKTA
jgi:hypothetical protein